MTYLLFSPPFHDCAFGNGRIDHFMDLLNDLLKGTLLSKALTCMIFVLYKHNSHFVKKTDTFGYIVV